MWYIIIKLLFYLLVCRLVGEFSGKGLKLEIVMVTLSSVGQLTYNFASVNLCLGFLVKIWSLTIISDSPVQAFQKLIYVSTLAFGEASPFLLPWKRVFKVTDSQVFFGLLCLSIFCYRIQCRRVRKYSCFGPLKLLKVSTCIFSF